MLLAIDVGNTNITLGLYKDNVLRITARLSTDTNRTVDQYAIDIKNVLELHSITPEEIEDAIVSTVVPTVGSTISRAVALLCHIVPFELGPGVKTGLNIKIDNPAQLGADLVAAAVGALGEYTLPCIVIDMGTATTISVLDSDGAMIGGAIAAGVNLTLKALTQNTSLLPSVNIEAPPSPIGRNTVDCIKAGLIYGTASMLDGYIERIENQLGASATVVATGGLSREIISHCKHSIIYNENLLLDGLRIIYEKNN